MDHFSNKLDIESNHDLVRNLCSSYTQDVMCLPGDTELLADTLNDRVVLFQRCVTGNLRGQIVPEVVHTSKRPIAMATGSGAADQRIVYVVDAFAPTVHALQVPVAEAPSSLVVKPRLACAPLQKQLKRPAGPIKVVKQ